MTAQLVIPMRNFYSHLDQAIEAVRQQVERVDVCMPKIDYLINGLLY